VNSRLRFLESEATMFENANKFAARMPQILINILQHTPQNFIDIGRFQKYSATFMLQNSY
jgi:uncharacterized protein (DUF2267 family)